MKLELPGFQNYPPFLGVDLDELHRQNQEELCTKPIYVVRMDALTAPLALTHPVRRQHWLHSIRVSMTSRRIAEHRGMDPKKVWYPGSLHDVGKALIPVKVLGKTSGWTDEDSRIMRSHVMYGYNLVHDVFAFSADVLLWHHKFQENGYPKRMPPPTFPRSSSVGVTVPRCGRIVALADSFDAAHRINNRGDGLQALNGEEIYQRMLGDNPDIRDLVIDLYKAGIFTKEVELIH